MIVDTSYLLDLLEGDRDAFRKGEQLHGDGVVFRLPAMTIAELFVGVSATGDDDEARQIENILMGHQVIDMDERIARKAGWIMGQTGLAPGDAIIGATAVLRDEPVLTADVDDFGRIDDVVIESY